MGKEEGKRKEWNSVEMVRMDRDEEETVAGAAYVWM